MRLTNVAQMDLVSGRLFSYGVRAAAEPGSPLPVSFDQGRHVGEGQRPGSWMAIAMRLPGPTDHGELAAAWDAVVARHGTLRTAFSLEPSPDDRDNADAARLHAVEVAPGTWEEHPVAEGRRTREVLRELFDQRCSPLERPSHRICLVEPGEDAGDARPDLVIGSDHAHVDMWSLVILARDLLACLEDVRAGRVPGSGLPDAGAFSDHTALLEAMPPTPPDVERRWADILEAGDGLMPTFPLPLGAATPLPPEVVEVRDVLDAAGTAELTATAKAQGVRLIALGLSVLTAVTERLSGAPLRAVFPVHSRHDERWRESIGWLITNAVLESADPDPAACVTAVQDAIGLGSWPLAPIFAPYGGMPTGPGLFAVSWLDARRLPVPGDQASELRYVSASIRTDGVMIWFLVNSTGLHLRCRYPDTPEAREHVGRWLDEIEAGIQALQPGRATA